MALTDFTIIRRSLHARLFSTVTTVLTVAVAVGLMLTLLAMRDSGRKAFDRGTGNMHILVSADASPLVSVLNSVFYANAPQRAMKYSRYEQLASDPRLAFAIPVQQGDSFQGHPTMATVPEFFTTFRPDIDTPFEFRAGGPFKGEFEVVFGAEAAEVSNVKLGDKICITHGLGRKNATPRFDADGNLEEEGGEVHTDFPFTVVGILRPTASAHDRAVFIPLQATWLIHADDKRKDEDQNAPRPTLADLQDGEKLITGVYLGVKGRAGSEAPPLVPVLFSELRRDPTLTVALPGAQVRTLFQIVGNIDRIIIAIAGVVLVSSGIAIMLALYNSMEQRRRQIAVLRVLGASRGRIFGLILTESAVIGALGSAAGVLLCLAGIRVVALVMKERLGLVIDASLPPDLTLIVGVGTVLLASVAGLVPAISGYRTSVSRSLRPMG